MLKTFKIIYETAISSRRANQFVPLNHQIIFQGHPRLVKILAEINSPILGVEIDPLTNILVTFGAQHALYCAVRNILTSNDEVVVQIICP